MIWETYRKDEVENDQDIFAEQATAIQSHDEELGEVGGLRKSVKV